MNEIYLALSGTSHGVTKATTKGRDVTIVNFCQSAIQYAIHGNILDATAK